MFVFQLKNEVDTYFGDLIEVSLQSLSDPVVEVSISAFLETDHEQVRLEGLKLMGSLLSAFAEAGENGSAAMSEQKLFQIQEQLASLANMDQSAQCRSLAEQFLNLFKTQKTQ